MNERTEQIVNALRNVLEPVKGVDIITLRMLRDLRLDAQGGINMNIYTPGKAYSEQALLYQRIHDAIGDIFPNTAVHVHFIHSMPAAEAPNLAAPQIGDIIAVASGKGGVGKSTISASLASALIRAGYRVGLMDADLYGPSIPAMFGITGQKPDVAQDGATPRLVPIQTGGLHIVSLGNIIEPEQAVVLRGPRLAAIIKQFFNDTAWPPLDYLIVDLPPGTGDIQLTLVQTIPLTGVVMVTTPQEIAYIDAVKAANMFQMEQIAVPVLGVIENMSWFEPPELAGKRYHLFGQGAGQRLADYTQSTLLGQLPIVEEHRRSMDTGQALSSGLQLNANFDEIAALLIKKVELRKAIFSPGIAVKVQS
ncbi:MAG: Mrp/NBP35 family ATP-binding protein [Saprospiraceae bacterium]|nr:Mrp/NBP35 family ATP-binding protein [Saprospiraceae bacterium]